MTMKTSLSANPSAFETECLAVIVFDRSEKDRGDKDKPQVTVESSDPAVLEATAALLATGDVTGKMFEATFLHAPGKIKAKRLLLVGGGKAKTFSNADLRRVAGAAARAVKGKNIRSFAFVVPPSSLPAELAVRTIVEGLYIADFDSDTYKTDRKDQSLQSVAVLSVGDPAKLQSSIEEGRILGDSLNFTRELVNEPSNRMTPTILAERASKMAAEVGLKCEVFGADKIKELKMGAFWGVAQGSDEPPALIVLRYEPADAVGPVLGLVGKGVTFDTGGISIKPADGMEKMKYDMAGGATMLGAMRAIALLKLKRKVICIVCATENMPSGKAQKPGDVQIAMSGKAIEIINTDAEGRLILADGLHYARQLGCQELIDAATLTGAVVVALGAVNAGVFCNNDGLYDRFLKAQTVAGEKMWRMPLDEEYGESIRSNIADIINSGGRQGGAITAAMFLKEFVEDTPWIHLDIAGTTWIEDGKPWIAKGPSGIALRSIVEFARS